MHQAQATDYFNNAEVSLSVNPQGADVMVAWVHFRRDEVTLDVDQDVWYNVSTDGATFTQSSAFHFPRPLPYATHIPWTQSAGDPFTAYSRVTGTGWVGAINLQSGGLWVCTKPPAQAVQNGVRVLPGLGTDKPLIAVGPAFGGGSDVLSAFHTRAINPANTFRLRGITSPSLGSTWPSEDFPVGSADPNGNAGSPGSVLVLPTGRRVVSYRDVEDEAPKCIFTEDNVTWSSPVSPTFATNPATGTPNEQVFGIAPGLLAPHCTGAIAVVIYASMARNPRLGHENDVYMLFAGSPTPINHSDVSLQNCDLYLARSVDGGQTFPPESVLHLRDSDLAEATGAQQFLGTLTVDGHGGLNIGYISATTDDIPRVWSYTPRYARLATFQAFSPTVNHLNLGNSFSITDVVGLQESVPVPASSGGGVASSYHWLGDYNGADSRGCDVYFGLPSRDGVGGVNVFVSKVRVCPYVTPPADVNGDSYVNVSDAVQFAGDFVAGAPAADLNHSGAVTTDDANLFFQSYACGCNP